MKWLFIVAGAVAALVSLLLFLRGSSAVAAESLAKIQAFEECFPDLPKDAVARRARSNSIMHSEGVPVNEWLPVIEAENDLSLPSTEQVAMRAAATLVVALKAHGMLQDKVDKLVQQYHLANQLSSNESKFIRELNPTEREREIQIWRYEAANVLMWALGFIDKLEGQGSYLTLRRYPRSSLIAPMNNFLPNPSCARNPKY